MNKIKINTQINTDSNNESTPCKIPIRTNNAIIKPTTIPDNALSKNLKIYNRAQDKKKT